MKTLSYPRYREVPVVFRAAPSRQRGTETVEFAITALLVFLLLFGVIEMAVLLFDKAVITDASRDAAREGILYYYLPFDTPPEDGRPDENLIVDTITPYLDLLIGFGSTAPENDVCTDITEVASRDDVGPCDCGNTVSVCIYELDQGGNTGYSSGDDLYVIISYDHQFFLLPNFPVGMGPNLMLSSTAMMRFE